MALALLLPEWLTSERYVTTATWGLVLATVLLVIDSWLKGNEQRDRWSREDSIRESEALPKAEFGLKASRERKLILWCANLGTVNFLLTHFRVDGVLDTKGSETQKVEPVVVPRGQIKEINISDETNLLRGKFLSQQWDVSLLLSGGARGEAWTNPKTFSVNITDRGVTHADSGLHGDRTIICPKCNQTALAVKLDGFRSTLEYKEEIAKISRDLTASCPNHESCSAQVRALPYIPEASGWITPEQNL